MVLQSKIERSAADRLSSNLFRFFDLHRRILTRSLGQMLSKWEFFILAQSGCCIDAWRF